LGKEKKSPSESGVTEGCEAQKRGKKCALSEAAIEKKTADQRKELKFLRRGRGVVGLKIVAGKKRGGSLASVDKRRKASI